MEYALKQRLIYIVFLRVIPVDLLNLMMIYGKIYFEFLCLKYEGIM